MELLCETVNDLQVWIFAYAKTMVNLNGRTDTSFAYNQHISCRRQQNVNEKKPGLSQAPQSHNAILQCITIM